MGRIGVIGGSGLYNIEGFKGAKQVSVRTPFGQPSEKFTIGNLGGREVVFLPRHGAGHRIPPSQINYRANIYGMKKLGVERIISVTACGSLKEEIRPLDFVVVDQFLDRTNHARNMTFFDQGITCHIEFAHPVCRELSEVVFEAGTSLGLNIRKGGTYVNMEGPAFSTLAESNLYRSWGMDVIGMTNLPEAKLAREAEICYVTLACVTDYDCWHKSHASVTVDMILENLKKNVENSKRILKKAISSLSEERHCSCSEALKYAIVTDPKMISQEAKRRLSLLIGKYIR
jgi:5'-methylthioadenosine phosphorylase